MNFLPWYNYCCVSNGLMCWASVLSKADKGKTNYGYAPLVKRTLPLCQWHTEGFSYSVRCLLLQETFITPRSRHRTSIFTITFAFPRPTASVQTDKTPAHCSLDFYSRHYSIQALMDKFIRCGNLIASAQCIRNAVPTATRTQQPVCASSCALRRQLNCFCLQAVQPHSEGLPVPIRY